MVHRGRTVLAMDCVLAGAQKHRGRPLNSVVRRHMIFALATDDGTLMTFTSEGEAASYCEGVDVEDGGWAFFGENGAPLAARFSHPSQRSRFAVVSGSYSLEPASGPGLAERLNEVKSVEGACFESIEQVKSHLGKWGRG